MLARVSCPYCGEENTLAVDASGGSLQRYVEDCQVCCQPWEVTARIEEDDCEISLERLDD